MLKLAEEYARLKGARVQSHRIDGNEIIFVLSSGPKLRMTEAELKRVIAKIVPKASIGSTTRAVVTPRAVVTKEKE